jgi:hypothetical protein
MRDRDAEMRDIDEHAKNNEWARGYTGTIYLSRTGQSALRSRIRQEEKERREAIAFWVKDVLLPMLFVLPGIIWCDDRPLCGTSQVVQRVPVLVHPLNFPLSSSQKGVV